MGVPSPVRQATALSRRSFLLTAATGVTAAAAGGLVLSCTKASGDIVAPVGRGSLRGQVVDALGAPQPALGRLTLMYESGLRTGAYADTDAAGVFTFTNLLPGNYQVRFDAPGVAHMIEEVPVPAAVRSGEVTALQVHAQRGPDETDEVQIYIGDYFYQAQPFGIENGETVLKLGVKACWYNVGQLVHSVTGGPWVESGDMGRPASFMWVADRVGVFGYRCRYHPDRMQGTLRVTS